MKNPPTEELTLERCIEWLDCYIALESDDDPVGDNAIAHATITHLQRIKGLEDAAVKHEEARLKWIEGTNTFEDDYMGDC